MDCVLWTVSGISMVDSCSVSVEGRMIMSLSFFFSVINYLLKFLHLSVPCLYMFSVCVYV